MDELTRMRRVKVLQHVSCHEQFNVLNALGYLQLYMSVVVHHVKKGTNLLV